MKCCSRCNKTWPNDFNACPDCGLDLTTIQSQSGVNMDTANAVNGGVHSTDDHSVHDSNNLTNSHNASNSYNTTYKTTINEAQKSESELLNENILAYRLKCKKLFDDGLISSGGEIQLREMQIRLNLADEIVLPIKEEIRLQSKKRKKQLSLVGTQDIRQTKTIIEQNQTSALQRQLDKLDAYMQEYDDDSLKLVYYQMSSMLEPVRYTNRYEESTKGEYWETYWAYIAYMLQKKIKEANVAFASLGKWHAYYPEQNDIILRITGQLMQNDSIESVQRFRNTLPSHTSPDLQLLLDTIDELLQKDYEKESLTTRLVHAFYINTLFTEFFNTQKVNGQQRLEDAKKRKAQEEQDEKNRHHEEELARQAAAKAESDAYAEAARLANSQQEAENIARAQELARQQHETEEAAAIAAKEKAAAERAKAKRIEQERQAAEEEELRKRTEEKRRQLVAMIAWLERNIYYLLCVIIAIITAIFLYIWIPKWEEEKEQHKLELQNYELLIDTCKKNISESTTDNLVPLDSASQQLIRLKGECKRLEQDTAFVRRLNKQFICKAQELKSTLNCLSNNALFPEQSIKSQKQISHIESLINQMTK